MPSLGEIDGAERRIRAAVVALNKRRIKGITLVEAVDLAELWPGKFDEQQPFLSGQNLSALLDRAPLYLCAIASEIGFRFEGVGTEYWNKLADAFGQPITMSDRANIGAAFESLCRKYSLSRPSDSAFSNHFSIISWPIANALLPVDLVAPVTRMLSRAPTTALPGVGRSINFASLRAWASAAEGARLTDWLRFEPTSERVLTALLTENRAGTMSPPSYARINEAVTQSAEAFFATRIARQRTGRSKMSPADEQSNGRLTVVREPSTLRLYVTWPPLPAEVEEEARVVARAAGWRPQLWCSGPRLHSDTALGGGPFTLTQTQIPRPDQPAYSDAASVFGEGTKTAVALAARTVNWGETLMFDLDENRERGEQRSAPFDGTRGPVWIATCAEITGLDRLRPIGSIAGYRVFEADLADEFDRAILIKESLLAVQDRTLVARHPVDAITAPAGVVRPGRPFILYRRGPPPEIDEPQRLRNGDRITSANGIANSRLRCEPATGVEQPVVTLTLFERDTAFSAIVEARLQLRIESPHALKHVPITAELDIDGKLAARCLSEVEELPVTIDQQSSLLGPLYTDTVRTRLLETGVGTLRFAVGRLAFVSVPLSRPVGAVDWSTYPPKLIDSDDEMELASATGTAPHRFTPADAIAPPDRGATGFVLRHADGRIADPMYLLASPKFNLGDFGANFSRDIGSRRLRDGGRGTGEIARALVTWSRAQCGTLQALAAKSRIMKQFEDPLVFNLCGQEWYDIEHEYRSAQADPHETLYHVALQRGLATLPDGVPDRYARDFAQAFAVHARRLDPDWPLRRSLPLYGTMDDALNLGFADAVTGLQLRGELDGIDPEDCDFGSPEDDWVVATEEAMRRIRRSRLASLIAPSEGGSQLQNRFYAHVGTAEMADDLAAWTRAFALPRGHMTAEIAASALQLWLSPSACNALDAAMRILVNDPFVARATRYVVIRMHSNHGSFDI